MNKSMIIGIVAGGLVVTAAGAFAGYNAMAERNSAEVLSVTAVNKSVKTSRQVCNDETVTHQAATKDPKRVTGAVVGALLGGVVGNKVGDDGGEQAAATAIGAVAGGYAGSKVQKHVQEDNTYQTVEQRCRTVYDSTTQPDGYDVRYRLDGREATVRMDRDPGRRIPVENGLLVTD
jgi:uncharacterized protein YcfJ